jgi:iron(III) transport system permease protein
MRRETWRSAVAGSAALFILAPVALVIYQSFLSAPFYSARARLGLSSYAFILSDADFWYALGHSLTLSASMVLIAVPLGSLLAFLTVRTDVPGRRWLEPAILLPLFVSPMVLAFGYIVSAGPVGFITIWWQNHLGTPGWNIYSFAALILVVGLTHVPHVYIYVSAALRTVPSDLEEAARVAGATPFQVARRVTLPLVWPSIAVAAVLVFFLGFELFGLPYVLGDPEGRLVLATYLYKLTTRLGTPAYNMMAVVVIAIMLFTLPLVLLQRRMLRSADRHATMRGKAARPKTIPLGKWRWVALALIAAWLLFVVAIPLIGITVRSFVSAWGSTVTIADVLTLDNYRAINNVRGVGRSIVNTLLVAIVGGLLSVCVFTLLALASHRSKQWSTRALDFLVLLPRAMPGIIAGLVVFWLFLFIEPLKPFVTTLATVWIAYTLVWLPFGLRLISNSLGQVSRELEEAAAVSGAKRTIVARQVILPLARHGIVAAWLLTFLLYVREYSTGIYLFAPGSEVMGAMLVNLWTSGNIDVVAALSVINSAAIAVGIAIALRFGIRLDA